MGSRRLSLRPTIFLFILAALVVYLSGPLSRGNKEVNSSIQLSFSSDGNTTGDNATVKPGPSEDNSDALTFAPVEVHSHASTATVTVTGMRCPSATLDPDDDETEFFPSYSPNSPKQESFWINVPSKENYLTELSKTDKGILDSLLPPSNVDSYLEDDEIGDGYGGGKSVKWLSRREKFDNLYKLGTPKAWREWISGQDGSNMPQLTKFAQEHIYRHQNPTEGCKGKKFLVMNAFPSDENFGLGAIVQAVGNSLSVALRTDRILLYNITNPPGKHFISDSGQPCGRSFDCIFLPLSSCSIPTNLPPDDDPEEPVIVEYPVHEQVAEKYFSEHPWSLPPLLTEALKRYNKNFPGQGKNGEQWEGMTFDAARYWWRTQAAAYIVRLNTPAMQHLRDMRLNKFSYNKGPDSTPLPLNTGWDCKTSKLGECTKKEMPFPLEAGGFSMHIRHGDKGIEMKLVDLPRYINAVEHFIKRNPMGFRHVAFISTEDPDVLEDAKALSLLPAIPRDASEAWKESPRWSWYWSDIPRLNVGPEEQLRKLGGGNRTEMTMGWMLQLMMALEADAWVGTRGSGWNRLVDQLRCVWVAGCKKPFLEVGTSGSWKYYGN